MVGNVDVDEGEGEKEGAEGEVPIGTNVVVGEDPKGHRVEENVGKRGYEGEAESFNEEGLVDVNINRDRHSDSDWDDNVECDVESAYGGESWYTTQESTDSNYDEIRTEGGGSYFEWHSDELFSGLDIDEVNDDIEGYGSDEGVTNRDTSIEAPSRRITRSMSRGESSIPSPLSFFCITLV